jgi:hypothetical protein
MIGKHSKSIFVMLSLQADVGDPHPARAKLRPWYRLLRHSAQNHKSLRRANCASAPLGVNQTIPQGPCQHRPTKRSAFREAVTVIHQRALEMAPLWPRPQSARISFSLA